VKYIKNAVNKGPNYARNVGIVASDGEYVLFLDSDCEIINKKMIQNMLRAIKTIPNVGTLGGFFNKNSKKSRAYVNVLNDVVYFDLRDPLDLKKCDVVAGCNFFVKKELLYTFKGFDDYIVGDSDEVEFNLTLIRNGYVNLFGPSISVIHYRDKAERDNLGIHANTLDTHTKKMLRILHGERNYLRYFLKNIGIKAFLKAYMLRYFSVYLIPMLAFVKQSITGFKDKNNNKLSLKLKIGHFLFLSRVFIDPFAWNIFNFYKIKRCRDINFLENKNIHKINVNLN
jgi:GT2 family glycosyltransferase